MRFCSLQSGSCRALDSWSTLVSTVLRLRFSILNSEWPEHKALERASMDPPVNLQLSSLVIKDTKIHKGNHSELDN